VTLYHRGKLPEVPASVHQLHIQKREGGEGVRLWVDDLDGLLGLVAMDAVELHPWNATIDDIERADRIVIDLDPGEGVDWDFVVDTALTFRDLLHAEGLKSWPKVTGGKGLHLMAPLDQPIPHDGARQYARRLVQTLMDKKPDQYLLSASPAARRGRIFLDYLRNGRGNTARFLSARASQFPDRMPDHLVPGGEGDSGGCLHDQKPTSAHKHGAE